MTSHREALPQTISRGGRSGGGKVKLWAFARDPIKQPLLKKLENNHDMVQEAISIFLDILDFLCLTKFIFMPFFTTHQGTRVTKLK